MKALLIEMSSPSSSFKRSNAETFITAYYWGQWPHFKVASV
jgi:hypothetical protein